MFFAIFGCGAHFTSCAEVAWNRPKYDF